MELGVMVTMREETDFDAAFITAREAGYARGQVTVAIHGITAEEIRQMAVAARQAQFYVDAVGCYINPLRLTEAGSDGMDLTDWKTVVANMGMMNGVERVVCWSGTLSNTIDGPNLLNHEEDAFHRLFVNLHALLEQVRGLGVRLILEPFTTQVLSDARACLRMAQKFPNGELGIVLDAPNIIPNGDYTNWDVRAQQFVAEVAPAVGLIHLKDLGRDEAGRRVFLPPGQGTLTYAPYLSAIARNAPEVPLIIDSVHTYEQMRAARQFVEGVLKEYGL